MEWDNDNYLKQIEELKSKYEASKESNNSNQSSDNSNPDSNWIISWTWEQSLTWNTSWNNVSLDIIAGNEALTDSPEFIESINWMYDNGITS